ncbi:dCTP deaminase [Paenibacillus xylanexedens]
MLLSDRSLRVLAEEHNIVTPFRYENCEGATINLTLDSKIKKCISKTPITLGNEEKESDYEVIDINETSFSLKPKESVIVKAVEYFNIPSNMVGLIFERYSIKLTGLSVSPASYMNPGYQGTLSFIVVNNSSRKIRLIAGVSFCQLALSPLDYPADTPYNKQDARYLGARDVSISKLHLDREIQGFLVSRGVSSVSDETAGELGKHLMKMIDNSADRIVEELKKKFGDPK